MMLFVETESLVGIHSPRLNSHIHDGCLRLITFFRRRF
jgi:hypothetical protein